MTKHSAEQFYTQHAKFYDFTRTFTLFDRKRAVQKMNIQKGEKIAEFGSGTGSNITEIRKYADTADITGIDLTPSMLEEAREKHPDLTFVQADITQYQSEQLFDKILCSYVLTVILEWKQVVANMAQNLKPGGQLTILDFHATGIWEDIRPLISSIAKPGLNEKDGFTEYLTEYFTDIEIETYHGGYNFIAQMRKRS